MLGLDPAELEPEAVDDGAALLDVGLPSSAPARLLETVTEELAFRWRAASTGQFSPTSTRRPLSTSEPVTPYPYLEKRLRKADAEGYAAAGLLPFVTVDDTDATADAIMAALLRASGPPPPQQQGRVMELLTPARPQSAGSTPPVLPSRQGEASAAHTGGGEPLERRRPPLDSVHVLLARQGSAKKNRGLASSLSFLGGKRERTDSGPLATALREAREETSGLLGSSRLASELLGPVLWFPQGRFALFLYSMPRSAYGRLRAPSSSSSPSSSRGAAAARKVAGTEVVELQWLAITDVLAISRAKQMGVARFCRAVMTTPQLFRYFIAVSRGVTEQREATAKQAALGVQAVRDARAATGPP